MMTIAESPAMSAEEDASCSLRAIAAMAASSPTILHTVWADRDCCDRTTKAARESTEAHPAWRNHAHYVAWVELFNNTAHEAAKLLLAARDLVVITDGGISQAYWQSDLDAFASNEIEQRWVKKHGSPDYVGFIAETMPASCEFQPGAPETEALCAALIAAGSKAIDA